MTDEKREPQYTKDVEGVLYNDPLANALRECGKRIGIDVLPQVDTATDGIRLRAKLPLIYSVTVLDRDDLMLAGQAYGPAKAYDIMWRSLEALQRSLFSEVYKHLEKHDRDGEAESLKSVAKKALHRLLAERPFDLGEKRDYELLLEYVTRERK